MAFSFVHTEEHSKSNTGMYITVHTKQKQSKAYGSHAEHGYFPVNQYWDACAPLKHLSLVKANPPGAGLVTRRRTVQVAWKDVAEP